MGLFEPIKHISSEEAMKRMQAALDAYWKIRFDPNASPASKSLSRDVVIKKIVDLGFSPGQAARYADKR